MEPKAQPINRATFLRGGFRNQTRNRVVAISDACLSAKGIVCRTCEEQCDPRAISFRLALGGVANAHVEATACTGCGECIAPCPVTLLNFWRPTHDYIRNSCPRPTKPNERCSGATYKNTRRQNPRDDAQLPIGGRKLTAVNAATVTTLTTWTSQFKKSAPANATPSLSKKIKPAWTATKASHTNCLRGRSRRRRRCRGDRGCGAWFVTRPPPLLTMKEI